MRSAMVVIDLDDKKVERFVFGPDNKSMIEAAVLRDDVQAFSEMVNETLVDLEYDMSEKKEEE